MKNNNQLSKSSRVPHSAQFTDEKAISLISDILDTVAKKEAEFNEGKDIYLLPIYSTAINLIRKILSKEIINIDIIDKGE